MTAHLRGMENAARIEGQAAGQLAQIGAQLGQFALRSAQARNTAEIATADVALKGAFDEYRNTLGPDPNNWLTGWQDRRKELLGQLLDDRKDLAPEVRRRIELNAKAYSAETDLSIKLMADKRNIDYSKARTDSAYWELHRLGDSASAEGLLGASVEQGLFSPPEADKMRSAAAKMQQMAEISERIRLDPHALLEDLKVKEERQGLAVTGGDEAFVEMVKGFEGFAPEAKWDYSQYSVGYGTKGAKGQRITPEEADSRLKEELSQARTEVETMAQEGGYQFNGRQMEALTSFHFNTGDARQLLIENGKRTPEQVAAKMLEYTRAEGAGVLPGLVKRRQKEVEHFNSPDSPGATAPTAEVFSHYSELNPVDRQRLIAQTMTAVAEREAQDADEVVGMIENDQLGSEAEIDGALASINLPEPMKAKLKSQWEGAQVTDWDQLDTIRGNLTAFEDGEDPTGRNYHELKKQIAVYAPAHMRSSLNAVLDSKADPGSPMALGIDVIDSLFKSEGRIYLPPGPARTKAQMDAYKRFDGWLTRQADLDLKATGKSAEKNYAEIEKAAQAIAARAFGVSAEALTSKKAVSAATSTMAPETREDVIKLLQGRDSVDLTGTPLTDEEVKAAEEKKKAEEEAIKAKGPMLDAQAEAARRSVMERGAYGF